MRRQPSRAAAVAAIVAIGVSLACDRHRRRWAAERTLRAYDEALVGAYRMSDVSRLRGVAVAKEVDRVQVLIDLKRSNRLVLESTLQSMAVAEVKATGPDGLVARTSERWSYFDRPTQPGRVPGPTFVARMEMEYDLVREAGVWKVAKGRTLDSVYLEPKGFDPGAVAKRRGPAEGPGDDGATGRASTSPVR